MSFDKAIKKDAGSASNADADDQAAEQKSNGRNEQSVHSQEILQSDAGRSSEPEGSDYCRAICLSGTGILDPHFADDDLLGYLTRAQVTELKTDFDKQRSKYVTALYVERKFILEDLKEYAEAFFGARVARSLVVGQRIELPGGKTADLTAMDVDFRVIGEWLEASHKAYARCARALSVTEPGQAIIDCAATAPMVAAQIVMDSTAESEKSGTRVDSAARYHPGLLGLSGAMLEQTIKRKWFPQEVIDERYAVLKTRIEKSIEAEESRFLAIREALPNRRAGLSFSWLRLYESYWVLEVVFWTWFGVLAKAYSVVFVAYKSKAYDARMFTLVLPRMIIAPLMSVILFAAWAAGFTERGVNISNLPFFLLASFLMGYGSDRVSLLIGELTDQVLRISPSEMREQWKLQERHLLENDRPVVLSGSEPETRAEFRRLAVALAKNIMEKELVRSTQTSR